MEKNTIGEFIKKVMCLGETRSEHDRGMNEEIDKICGLCRKKGNVDDFIILCYVTKGECFASVYHK